jgi:hypothetical protein
LNNAGLDEDAESQPIAVVLIVAITIIISAILLCHIFYIPSWYEEPVPSIYQITSVRHTDSHGHLNYESYLVLTNNGNIENQNWNLYVRTYVNGIETHCNIPSLNANQFINSVHTDVQTIGSLGSDGTPGSSLSRWYRTQTIAINYENGIFHPGDTITIDVYEKSSGKIVSRDTWPRTDPRTTTSWWMSVFTHQAA